MQICIMNQIRLVLFTYHLAYWCLTQPGVICGLSQLIHELNRIKIFRYKTSETLNPFDDESHVNRFIESPFKRTNRITLAHTHTHVQTDIIILCAPRTHTSQIGLNGFRNVSSVIVNTAAVPWAERIGEKTSEKSVGSLQKHVLTYFRRGTPVVSSTGRYKHARTGDRSERFTERRPPARILTIRGGCGGGDSKRALLNRHYKNTATAADACCHSGRRN